MANMSYCRFHNTRIDLRDCVNAMVSDDVSDLSEDEREAMDAMYQLCKRFIVAYDRIKETEDVQFISPFE